MLDRRRSRAPARATAWATAYSLAQQPGSWLALAGALALFGGRRGRRAAWRGVVSYGLAAVAANMVMKPLVSRERPPEAGGGIGPITSSFPPDTPPPRWRSPSAPRRTSRPCWPPSWSPP